MSAAIQKIKDIIDTNQRSDDNFRNFVLQGGAGSGKTESLKEIISYISERYPERTIACITHTNVAVDEIKARVGNDYEISTIHSFLNDLIKRFKKNLREVLPDVFHLEIVKNEIHEEYKKCYGKYSNKLYSVKKEIADKVIGKRDYDKSPAKYNSELNTNIVLLNGEVSRIIQGKDFKNIGYNETRFDSFEDMTFSHDSLLLLANKLSVKFDLLPQIISNKFDFIFIDEYQDTSNDIIDLFLNLLPDNKKTTVGLFGDSMQGIYDDGVGDVNTHIERGLLRKIDKEDNFRCSEEVINFINTIRNDDIEQKIALKKNEVLEDRRGAVQLIYSIVDGKPTSFGSREEKDLYSQKLEALITSAKKNHIGEKVKLLVLTNKSISGEGGFPNLYRVFDDRFSEVKEEIEKELSKIQITELAELCKLYQTKTYNKLIVRLKKNGFQIKTVEDKNLIATFFQHLLAGELSVQSALSYSLEKKIIKKSERLQQYSSVREKFLEEIEANEKYKEIEKLYVTGSNTIKRLKDNHDLSIADEVFSEFEKAFKKKRFYRELFSEDLKFKEVINYYSYLNEETDYITMHKTKGSGIENVIVVLDEYFWNKYNFKSIYDPTTEPQKRLFNQKLFYVACSRAIKNLTMVRLVEGEDEEKKLKAYFTNCAVIKM
jgi:DNA helicase-2/ATP-dependent DNA helicase PcrA